MYNFKALNGIRTRGNINKMLYSLNYRHRQEHISIRVRYKQGGVKATQLCLTPLAAECQVSEKKKTRRLHLNELLLNSCHRRVICARAYESQCLSFLGDKIISHGVPIFLLEIYTCLSSE